MYKQRKMLAIIGPDPRAKNSVEYAIDGTFARETTGRIALQTKRSNPLKQLENCCENIQLIIVTCCKTEYLEFINNLVDGIVIKVKSEEQKIYPLIVVNTPIKSMKEWNELPASTKQRFEVALIP